MKAFSRPSRLQRESCQSRPGELSREDRQYRVQEREQQPTVVDLDGLNGNEANDEESALRTESGGGGQPIPVLL